MQFEPKTSCSWGKWSTAVLQSLPYPQLLPSCGFTDLVVKEEVDRGDEEALEGVEEVGREGPDGKGQPGSSQRVRPHEVQHVGDAQQRQQEEKTLKRFPGKKIESCCNSSLIGRGWILCSYFRYLVWKYLPDHRLKNKTLISQELFFIHSHPPYPPHLEKDRASDNHNYWIAVQGWPILTLTTLDGQWVTLIHFNIITSYLS